MGHKSRTQKKKFACNHVGYGNYCHLCSDLGKGIAIISEQKKITYKKKVTNITNIQP